MDWNFSLFFNLIFVKCFSEPFGELLFEKYEKTILPCLQVQPKCDISPKPECWIPESDNNDDDDDVVDLRDTRGLMLCMQL